jgi:Pyruvate/2-oxoacid:ferredoxin oxidoreductase delta subunit
MPAIHDEIADAEEEGVGFQFLIQPIKVSLLKNKRLAVKFQRMKLSGLDQSHRSKAIPVKGKFLTLEADHVITAVGEHVDLSWIPQDLIKKGLIEVNPSPKIFAGGDAVDQPRTIVTAIASGKKAAISIDLYLKGESLEKVFPKIRVGNKGSVSMEAYLAGRDGRNWTEPLEIVSYEKLNTLFFEPSKRIKVKQLNLDRRPKGFSEVNVGFSSEEATLSASRCFSCGTCNYCYNCYFFCPEGAVSFDPIHGTRTVDFIHCKGCGTCAKSCPRNVVEMKETS